ncbi:laminin subunit alpha-2-like isoform X2 [Babylonia areolata]|uniref:laminin subunit alpha-2-like isoform X2 n=1 Tax=Babylonia areolata TaxID=304850 RepID=UPI003FD26BED
MCSSSSVWCSRMWQCRVMQHVASVVCLLFLTLCIHPIHAARSVRRLCKNEIDLMSDEGVRIEPFQRSHVELLLADQKVRSRNAIRFEFRTNRDNGILFYGRERQWDRQLELLALRLMGGDLYYKIHCSTVSADVLIPHPYKLNDGQWHSVVVRFRRGGMKTQIEVDGIKDSKIYEVSCRRMTSLVFGGVSPHDKHVVNRILGQTAHYDGCIRRVNVPPALRSPPKYFAISVCEQ